jgi:hypothetical protein
MLIAPFWNADWPCVMVVPQTNDETGAPSPCGIALIVYSKMLHRTGLAVLVLAPLLGGCSGMSAGDMFKSDLLSKDADWFSRSGRTMIKNVSIETPPLTPDQAVPPQDLIGADGSCPGMPPRDASALADGAASVAPGTGVVALGHTECDVARGAGAPDNVNIGGNPRGDRVTTLTYSRGPRAGIYTFTAGRLTMVEGTPQVEQPKPVRGAKKRRAG